MRWTRRREGFGSFSFFWISHDGKKDNSILLLSTFLGNGCTSTDSMEAPAQSGPFPWPYVIHCRRLTLRGSSLLDTSLVTMQSNNLTSSGAATGVRSVLLLCWFFDRSACNNACYARWVGKIVTINTLFPVHMVAKALFIRGWHFQSGVKNRLDGWDECWP